MKNILIGSKKSGWQVDAENRTLNVYKPISIMNKVQKKEPNKKINISDIDIIKIRWNTIPSAWGQNQHFVVLKVILIDGEEVSFEGTKYGVSKDEFIRAINLLRELGTNFDDTYNIFEEILNSSKSIWDVLENVDRQQRKKN